MTREQEVAVVQAVIDGDTNAFEVLIKEYEKNVYNMALRMTGSREDAEDMSQESFLRAYNSLSLYRGESKFSVWLYRIVSNVCLDFLRGKNRRPTVSLSVENDDGESEEMDIADESQMPERIMDKQLARDTLHRGLASIPPEQRETFLLRELQGLSYEEISTVTGVDIGTVKSRIFRARKKLCKFFSQDGNFSDFISSNKQREGDLS